jgi:hypothetical protein
MKKIVMMNMVIGAPRQKALGLHSGSSLGKPLAS